MLKEKIGEDRLARARLVDEKTWLRGKDFGLLCDFLCFLDREGYPRKFRLYGGACARLGFRTFQHPSTKLLARVIDALADSVWFPEGWLGLLAEEAADHRTSDFVGIAISQCCLLEEEAALITVATVDDADRGQFLTDRRRLAILRELFGNPFRQPSIDPAVLWRNEAAVYRLASSIYYGYTFRDMPRLADLLLQAGCEDPQVLEHCRSKKPHFRGCWLIDTILSLDQHPLERYNV